MVMGPLHSVRPGCQPPLDVQPQRLKRQRTSVTFPTRFRLLVEVALNGHLMIWLKTLQRQHKDPE